MVDGNATPKGPDTSLDANKVGGNPKPLTFQPFSELFNLGKCNSFDWFKQNQSQPGKKTSRLENRSPKIGGKRV